MKYLTLHRNYNTNVILLFSTGFNQVIWSASFSFNLKEDEGDQLI